MNLEGFTVILIFSLKIVRFRQFCKNMNFEGKKSKYVTWNPSKFIPLRFRTFCIMHIEKLKKNTCFRCPQKTVFTMSAAITYLVFLPLLNPRDRQCKNIHFHYFPLNIIIEKFRTRLKIDPVFYKFFLQYISNVFLHLLNIYPILSVNLPMAIIYKFCKN